MICLFPKALQSVKKPSGGDAPKAPSDRLLGQTNCPGVTSGAVPLFTAWATAEQGCITQRSS